MYCGRGDGSDFSVEVDQVATSEQLLRKNVDFSSLFLRLTRLKIFRIGVAEVGRWHGGPTPKSLDSDENFKPEHTLFFSQKQCPFGPNTVKEVHYYMVYSAYFTELNLKICDYAQK